MALKQKITRRRKPLDLDRFEDEVRSIFREMKFWTSVATEHKIKKNGKIRTVVVPNRETKKKLRKVLKWLRLHRYYKRRSYCIGGEPKKSRFDLIEKSPGINYLRRNLDTEVAKNSILIKIDLKSAFDHVFDYNIEEKLRKWAASERKEIQKPWYHKTLVLLTEEVEHIAKALCHNGSLAVGYPTSPVLFNRELASADDRIDGLIRSIRIKENKEVKSYYINLFPLYFRYVDDITIICDAKHRWVRDVVRRILNSEGFSISSRKSKIIPLASGWEVLGLCPTSAEYYAPKKMRRRMRGLAWKGCTGDNKAKEKLSHIINSIPIEEYRAYLESSVRKLTNKIIL